MCADAEKVLCSGEESGLEQFNESLARDILDDFRGAGFYADLLGLPPQARIFR